MPFSPAQFASPWPDPLAGMDRLGLAIEKVQMAKQRAEAQRQEAALGWARLQESQRHNMSGEGLMGQHYSQIDDRAKAQQAQAESHFQQTQGFNVAKQKQELEAKAQAAFMRGGPMDPEYVLYRQQMDALAGAPSPAAAQPVAPPEPQAPPAQEAAMHVAPVSPEQQQARVNAQQHLSKVLGMKAGEGSAGEAMNGVDLVPKVIESAALPQGGSPAPMAQTPAVAAARDPFDPMLREQALAANADGAAQVFDATIKEGGAHRFTQRGLQLGRALAVQFARSGRPREDAVKAGLLLAQQESNRLISEQNAASISMNRRDTGDRQERKDARVEAQNTEKQYDIPGNFNKMLATSEAIQKLRKNNGVVDAQVAFALAKANDSGKLTDADLKISLGGQDIATMVMNWYYTKTQGTFSPEQKRRFKDALEGSYADAARRARMGEEAYKQLIDDPTFEESRGYLQNRYNRFFSQMPWNRNKGGKQEGTAPASAPRTSTSTSATLKGAAMPSGQSDQRKAFDDLMGGK